VKLQDGKSSCTDGKLALVDIKINYLMPSAVFKINYKISTKPYAQII
jgi:hypothetical protein